MLRNIKWMVENGTCHLFTFSLAVILACNDNSINDKNSLLLAFLNKMYFAVAGTKAKINVSIYIWLQNSCHCLQFF